MNSENFNNVTAKTMLCYLYYVECAKSSLKVYTMIVKNIRPKASNEDINKWGNDNIDLLNNTICVVDEEYPFKNCDIEKIITNMFLLKNDRLY